MSSQLYCSSSSFSVHSINPVVLQHSSYCRPKILGMAANNKVDHHSFQKKNKVDHQHHQSVVQTRRTANYKPNIWKDDLLQSLPTEFSEKEYYYTRRIQKLKEDVSCLFAAAEANNINTNININININPMLLKLELVDNISKLGLDKYFRQEIQEALESTNLASILDGNKNNDLYSTALCFRLLRHYGHNAYQDMFMSFLDEAGKFKTGKNVNLNTLIELFEASNMARGGENILNEARLFSIEGLRRYEAISNSRFVQQLVFEAKSLPLQWRVEWYNVKKHINAYEKGHKRISNAKLIELSKLNFNLVQASHQQDLKDVSRWWSNLGINGKLSFSRDRIVESFLFAAGIASEAQYGSLRKWLTKVIKLILIVDDVYDIYGSLEELECFTNAVEMWRPEEVKDLPEGIKIVYWALLNTTEQIATEIQCEKGWNDSVLSHLHNTWADFCKSMLLEARWYKKGYTPSLEEYLENGWISSSASLLALLAILGVADPATGDVAQYLKDCRDITYHVSLIIRLCNDQGTSAVELERGDAASSILCYMREAKVSEEVAREHIKSLVIRTWRKINGHSVKTNPFLEEPVRYIINAARTAHYIYQNGDGFGVQDGDTRDQVLFNLIEPLQIES